MKIKLFLLLILTPFVAVAQNGHGMSEQDMQRMMQQMQQAGVCMQGIDQTKLKALEQQGRQMEQRVKSLCAQGKRDQAQSEALSFAKQMMSDPTVNAMRKCGDMIKGVMPALPFENIEREASKRNICD